MLTFLKYLILWTIFGFLVNNLTGAILKQILMRAFSEDEEACVRRIAIKNIEKNGYSYDPNGLQLIWNDLTWPVTIFLSIKGCVKILREGNKIK